MYDANTYDKLACYHNEQEAFLTNIYLPHKIPILPENGVNTRELRSLRRVNTTPRRLTKRINANVKTRKWQWRHFACNSLIQVSLMCISTNTCFGCGRARQSSNFLHYPHWILLTHYFSVAFLRQYSIHWYYSLTFRALIAFNH